MCIEIKNFNITLKKTILDEISHSDILHVYTLKAYMKELIYIVIGLLPIMASGKVV